MISSLALGFDGEYYNVNADEMAAACAATCRADALVFLTDGPGVRGADGSVMRWLSTAEIAGLTRDAVITGGMLPKLNACRDALIQGVKRVRILPGRIGCVAARSLQRTHPRWHGSSWWRERFSQTLASTESQEYGEAMSLEQIQAAEAKLLLSTYERTPILMIGGDGVHLIDEHGERYLDLLSGYRRKRAWVWAPCR